MTTTMTRPGPLEWRLYVVAALAGVQLLAWLAVIPPREAPTPPPTPAPAVFQPPPGWRVVTAPPAPRVEPVPVRRPLRVRTRSS